MLFNISWTRNLINLVEREFITIHDYSYYSVFAICHCCTIPAIRCWRLFAIRYTVFQTPNLGILGSNSPPLELYFLESQNQLHNALQIANWFSSYQSVGILFLYPFSLSRGKQRKKGRTRTGGKVGWGSFVTSYLTLPCPQLSCILFFTPLNGLQEKMGLLIIKMFNPCLIGSLLQRANTYLLNQCLSCIQLLL